MPFTKEIVSEGPAGAAGPKRGDNVTVHCTGFGKNGDLGLKFWSTKDTNEPFSFKIGLGSVIRGWDEGVMTMKKGETARITCSPDYAYGSGGFPAWGIMPNSTLIFEIESQSDEIEIEIDNDILAEMIELQQQVEKEESANEEIEKINVKYVNDISDNEENNRSSSSRSGSNAASTAAAGHSFHSTHSINSMRKDYSSKIRLGGHKATSKQQGQEGRGASMSDHRKSEIDKSRNSKPPSSGINIDIDQLWQDIYTSQSAKQDLQSLEQERIKKLQIPRKYARPIEVVLRICSRANPNAFDLLGLSKRSADETSIKKSFRSLTLRIHPDKNPHPDAKHAFDCIAEAYESALETLQRSNDNQSKSSLSSLNNNFRFQQSLSTYKKKFKKCVSNLFYQFDNIKARTNLLFHHLREGEWQQEVNELLLSPIQTIRSELLQLKDKFAYAPSYQDKLHLCGELLYDNKEKIACTILFTYFLQKVNKK